MGRAARDVLRIVDRDGRRVQSTPLDLALGGEGVTSDRHWLQAEGSEPVPIVEVAAPLGDADGNVDGAVLLLRDAGADRSRADASRLQRAVVDASPDAIVGIDGDGRIVSWNPAAQRMFGYDENQAHGRTFESLVAMRWLKRKPLVQSFDDMHAAVGPIDLCACGVTAGASGRPCRRPGTRRRACLRRVVADAARSRCAAPPRCARSAAGRTRCARPADTSNRLKDELLATVSHELRTPLNVIYGWVEVLRNSGDSALQQQAVDAIDRSARSLTRMVGDILDASSLATGKLQLDARPVDVVRLFSDSVGAFQTAASSAGIVLEFDCAASTCVVSGDAERLRQMLSNLVSNALKFTPSGGSVTVSRPRRCAGGADRERHGAGHRAGVPAVRVRHVPPRGGFAGVVAARAGPRPVDRAAYRRTARRRRDGRECGRNRGATFDDAAGRLAAGRRGGVGSAHVDALRAPLTLDTQRIMIVDDDPTTRESLTAALTTFGAAVAIASTGREALAVAADLRPTVVLSDLAMPDGDGFWLLDALRRTGMNGGGPPGMVLAVTAHAATNAARSRPASTAISSRSTCANWRTRSCE